MSTMFGCGRDDLSQAAVTSGFVVEAMDDRPGFLVLTALSAQR
jgi:hypothetical protein